MKNTPVYCDMYQESDLIHFMGDSINYNSNKILKILGNMENTSQKFFARFESEDNRITINLMEDNVGDVNVSIKDRDSNTCIYSFSLNADNSGSEWWTIPIPKPYFDFQEDRNFSGFLIEFYSSKTGELIQSLTIDIGKKSIMKKKIVAKGPINFDPIFVNYTQFFVDGIYNQFFAGSRIRTAIDIGANVGLFTEWVLDRFGNDTRVIAVEPNSSACLSFESMHAGKQNVTLDKLAVTSTDDETIKLMINPENTLISSIEGTGDGYSDCEEIGTISLMGILKKYNMEEIDLLKIDVEGAEYDIFSSVGENDLRRFKHLLIEFHNNQGRASGIISKIISAGFEIDLRDDDTRYTVDQNSDRGTIFATRK
jgi:FkbM family methyltransferase